MPTISQFEFSELLHNRERATHGESEFDKKRKNASLIQGSTCVLKQKVAKMRFLPKNDPFWGKHVLGILI